MKAINNILPRGTNFIITKIIDKYGTADLSWPYCGDREKKVPLGFLGFTFREERLLSVNTYGYLTKLEDGSICFLPRESFDLIDDKIIFLYVNNVRNTGTVSILNMKTSDFLEDENSNTLLFNNKENAEIYILENFEIYKNG